MKGITRLISVLTVAAGVTLTPAFIHSRKIRTKLPVKKEISKDTENIPQEEGVVTFIADTTQAWQKRSKAIRFYGFDKTVGSSTESFFIINGTDSVLTRIGICITYLDMQGRQLHSRDISLDCDIPAGETRRQDIKSWDIQKSFYFHQSVKPKRQATPFDVKIDLTYMSLSQAPDGQ